MSIKNLFLISFLISSQAIASESASVVFKTLSSVEQVSSPPGAVLVRGVLMSGFIMPEDVSASITNLPDGTSASVLLFGSCAELAKQTFLSARSLTFGLEGNISSRNTTPNGEILLQFGSAEKIRSCFVKRLEN